MTEIHDGKQSVETKRSLLIRESPIIVYFFYPWSSFYALNVATGLIGGVLYAFEGVRGYMEDKR